MTDAMTKSTCKVAAFYRFSPMSGLEDMQQALRKAAAEAGVLGTILLAEEGINGTVAGPETGIDKLLETLRDYPGLETIQVKVSWCESNPFYRLKVRLKKEIVTLGVAGIDPVTQAGEYIDPKDWNALISRPDVRVIDTRNDYEVRLGSFQGAENPGTRSFRDFPAWVETRLGSDREQPVAMFCTGGIRCEKSTALLKTLGYKNVYHLEGGILNYLEKIPASDSLWQGDCFVFDNRVTVDHDLSEGNYELCPACRAPLSEEDKRSPGFELNVSCPACVDKLTPERRSSLEERGRQIALARARGKRHLGKRQEN
jgi:UPF0176 protein